tara:strand:+ start:6334 stop:6678 length:345 start_codon:yes stop_codon:yes gene_type:complete
MGNTIIRGASKHITEYAGVESLSDNRKDEFRIAVQKYAEQQLEGRHKNGVLRDEVDFFAGAMSAMMVVNEMFFESEPNDIMDIVPVMWVIGPMSGRNYVGKKKKNKDVTYGEWK